jgi:hypothetical protein
MLQEPAVEFIATACIDYLAASAQPAASVRQPVASEANPAASAETIRSAGHG